MVVEYAYSGYIFSLENKSWKHKIEKVMNLCVGKNGL